MSLHFDDQKQNDRVSQLYEKEEEDLAMILAQKYGIPFVDLKTEQIKTNALRLISEVTARAAKIAPFDVVGKKLKVAILSPRREEIQNEITSLENRGYIVEAYIASTHGLEYAWERYEDITNATKSDSGSLDVSEGGISAIMKSIHNINNVREHVDEVINQKQAFKVSNIVEIILAGGIAVGASDVHFEPEEEFVRVRYRLDGVLSIITNLDHPTYKLLLSRIKLLSGLKLNIRQEAQDGRFSVELGDKTIEMRISVIPGGNGESIVMRILNPDNIKVRIEDMGIPQRLFDVIERETNRPNGLILNTGPTGSGKTTTLYALLSRKKGPNIKVITIEDPVEYHLEGIVQTQVDHKKNYTFASGLRAAMRQDPDVIMVGEIRDVETAEIAIHSALTGHLVFSTLHTNSAAGAFPRLMDLGIDSKIMASSVNLVLAQRLVRKLCTFCKKEVPIPESRRKTIERIFHQTPQNDLSEIPATIFEPAGCLKCNESGYKGRAGLFEGIKTTGAVADILEDHPSGRLIKKAAKDQGLMTLREDGINKLLKGLTSISELDRVIDIEEED